MAGRLVSAHNPMTGPRHLGHYVSTMREWCTLQDQYECFIVVDDLIAYFIYPAERERLLNRSFWVIREFLAGGLDRNRCHLVLTSMVPETTSLMLLLGVAIEMPYLERLYRESFCGLLKSYHRRQLGLGHTSSITEMIYPQLALPALTLGLQADAFQGGEEVTGYSYIMDELTAAFGRRFGAAPLKTPRMLVARTPFLLGIDGSHMVGHNAVLLSADEAELRSSVEQVTDYRVLAQWYDALGREDACRALLARRECQPHDRLEMVAFLTKQLEPFRRFHITNEDILDLLARGADAARTLLRDTEDRLKTALGIPAF